MWWAPVGAAHSDLELSPAARRPVVRWGIIALAAAICLSTLFLKQHTVLDVAGGLVLSALVAVPLYRRILASEPKGAPSLRRRQSISKTTPDAN